MANATFDERMKLNVKLRDILKDINPDEHRTNIETEIPESFYQTLLDMFLERGYLTRLDDKMFDRAEKGIKTGRPEWLQIIRLPIHPNEHEEYDLFAHWQGVLSSLHAWNYRLIFMLQRYHGETRLFLGAMSREQGVSPKDAIEQVREAAFGSMPGMEMRILRKDKGEVIEKIRDPLEDMNYVGAVTGIPSFSGDNQNSFNQTLDQLAFGVRDTNGTEKDYALIVVADPIPDPEISGIISGYRSLGSQIHSSVHLSTQNSEQSGESKQKNATGGMIAGVVSSGFGAAIGGIIGGILHNPLMGMSIGSSLGGRAGSAISGAMGAHNQVSFSTSSSITKDYLDKFADYAEKVTDHHVERLNEGRNMGFWNTGVYVLASSDKDVKTVTGILRSVYSGRESYYEPIRLHAMGSNESALDIIKRFDLIHIPVNHDLDEKADHQKMIETWHMFGKRFEYLSTPLNTTELALTTSLPRRDVPGLRFVKTAVRFANNPALIKGDSITLGNIVDTGVVQNTHYDIDVNSLVRHALVAGSTGSGKSTTCKRILSEVMRRNIPIMVIEPAKDDYVRWAIEQNKTLPDDKKFCIFMPGADEIDGTPVEQLHINPFQPAAIKNAKVDLLQHSENFSMLLNACLPSEEVVPILIDEVVYETICFFAEANGLNINEGFVRQLNNYPNVDMMELFADRIMENKTYEERNKENLKEVLVTRFKYLSRGMRGRILNVPHSTDYEKLFSGNVIINLSRLAGSKDKSLVMSLLMQALYEYRQSCYADDAEYRELARANRLCHLTLVEEAHNVLLKPLDNASSGSPQRAAAELFDNMLSEIRGYGEGFIVVDQVPTRLIDGATKNTNYKIVHRLTAPDDQAVMASCMAFRDDQKYIIPALEKGNAVICGDEDDAAVWVKMPAPGMNVI